jgi:hypothetical protein
MQVTLSELVEKYGNDSDLGAEYRRIIRRDTGSLDELALNFPNDFDLGAEIRKLVRK